MITYYERTGSWPEIEKAYATFLAHLVIHEMAHLGANMTQTIDYIDGTSENEHWFDVTAFGSPAYPGDKISEIVLRKPKP